MTSNLPNVVNPYLTDVGVGLVFGLGYYLIKYIYGDNKAKDNDKEVSSSKILDWDNPKTIEDFNYLIKQNEENTKLNPFDVISKMNKAHIIPDITVYNNLLNSCISSRNDENFDMLTKEIFDFGSPILPDLSTFNIIMKFISCKLDGIDPNVNQNEANDLVSYMDKTFAQIKTYGQNNKLIKPCDITINTALDILIKGGKISRAWELFDNMEKEFSVKPDKYSYSTIIKALKYDPSPEKLEKAFGILECIKENNKSLANDEIIFNCLIDVCIKLNEIEKAEKIFDEMKTIGVEGSKITYAIMIKGYGQFFKLEKAFKIFEEMKLANKSPNEIIYGCLLNACVRCSNIEKVTDVYKEMKQLNLDMNVVLYTTLIKAYTKVKDLRSALDVYYTMVNDSKIKPNIVVHNAILDCCVECGDTKMLTEIYNKIKDDALKSESNDQPQPDLITYSTVIKGHSRAKNIEKVIDVYKFLKENSDQFKLDEVIFNSILDGCSKTGNFRIAMEVYSDMEKFKIPKSNVTFSILIKLYANAGENEKAFELLEEMEKLGIKPGVIVYTCLIQMCFKTKLFDRGVTLFEKMKASGAKSDHVLYNTIINGCLYNQRWTLACDYTLESFQKNVKIADDIYHTCLFKLAAPFCNLKNSIKVDYANKILKEMKERGLFLPEHIFSKVAKMIYQTQGFEVDFYNSSIYSEDNQQQERRGNYNHNQNYKNNYNNYNNNNNSYNNSYNNNNGTYKNDTKDNLKWQRAKNNK